MGTLEQLFTAGVTSLSDGNGAHQVSRRPVVGASRVARFLATISSRFWTGLQVRWVSANGQTSAELSRDGTVRRGVRPGHRVAGLGAGPAAGIRDRRGTAVRGPHVRDGLRESSSATG